MEATQAPKKVGIVGSGLGAFMAYVVLRFRGISAEQISVIGPAASPVEGWLAFVRSIDQTSMRSESAAHFFPTDSPGLATIESLKNWTIKPTIMNWFDKYHPTVDTVIDHITKLVRQTGYSQSLIQTEVESIHRHGAELHVFGQAGKLVGRFEHIIVAVGHGQPYVPEPIKKFNQKYPHDKRVRHSFHAGEVIKPGQTVLVMGNGLSSATHWTNYLDSQVNLIAVAPHPFIMNQPLNTPRKYFSKRGFQPFRHQGSHGRYAELMKAKRGTFPPYINWHMKFATARRQGRLTEILGMVEDIATNGNGKLRVIVKLSDGHSLRAVAADHVISSTGFMPLITHPLWQTLIKQYNLPVMNTCLVVDDHFRVPIISQEKSIVGVIGSASEWAIPCADSFGGMKIVAHELANQIVGPESWKPRKLLTQTGNWVKLMLGKKLV
ncbi:MAG: SidA/IucD/PvdA family monooxygenase [Candidatus Andersenbacteria bacterium]|nr:SidA/IucD/PvdA family monooxygenase [Candidatus Andersenbacteria bacterium]